MADERGNRVPHLWLWVLAGAVFLGVLVLVLVLVVDPSLVIGSPPIGKPPTGLSVADELKARNDVRATLVQALAGLAVAGGLIVTYRTYRQNRAEQDRTYERELYAKAVEQLGHEKAPVRLGALYSLERLGEDKPERQQIIVDVICAYLRMPFSPTAPAGKPKPEATEAAKMPAAETERRTEGTRNTWQQERQVRLTAQRILAEHLRGDRARDKRSTGPSFWPGIGLDLAGATLIDFNLVNGEMADANFAGATFSGDAWFAGASFSGVAWFAGASFSGSAGFDRATFSGAARFGKATFDGPTSFGGVKFRGAAMFRRATFSAASFSGATFKSHAWFGATFTGVARFDGATFSGDEGSLSFDGSRVLSPDSPHVWPTGWCARPEDKDGYTVVRADAGLDTGLKPEEPPAAGTAGGA